MNRNTGLQEIIRNHKNITRLIFQNDEVLFTENQSPKGIYCIESGSVKIFKTEHTGQDRILFLAASGEILGLHSVVNNHPYTNSAAAISETKTCFISFNDFMHLINTNNTYKLLVMKSLCSRIDSMEEHILRVAEKTTNERFADTLLMLADKYGVNRYKELNINLTLDELASFTCTSKSYMKKIISEFSSKGLVQVSDKTIKILDLPKIKNITSPALNLT